MNARIICIALAMCIQTAAQSEPLSIERAQWCFTKARDIQDRTQTLRERREEFKTAAAQAKTGNLAKKHNRKANKALRDSYILYLIELDGMDFDSRTYDTQCTNVKVTRDTLEYVCLLDTSNMWCRSFASAPK